MDVYIQNSLFFMPFLVGSIFVLTGWIMYKFPPKKINSLYGYRTSNSMKSIERWNFAQKYASKLMIYCGIFLIGSSVLGLIFKTTEGQGVLISSILMIASLILLIYKTEKAIIQNFKDE